MTLPALSHTDDPFPGSAADAAELIVPDTPALPDALDAYPGLSEVLEAIGFSGASGSYARVHAPEVTALPLAVVGSGKSADETSVRDAAGTALRSLTGFENVSVALAGPLD